MFIIVCISVNSVCGDFKTAHAEKDGWSDFVTTEGQVKCNLGRLRYSELVKIGFAYFLLYLNYKF